MGSSRKRDVHVTPNNKDGHLNWSVKREGAQRASSIHENKVDAMTVARQIAQNNRLEVVEHRKDGIITGSNSYGNDPRKSRG